MQISRNLIGSGYPRYALPIGRHVVTIPFYWIWGSLIGLTLWHLRRVRRRLRDRDRCRCGYLLVGNTSGLCPECASPVGPAVETTLPTPS